ncbi:transposase [Burkholderia pseudomallei]|nr:transposase [Burkholderia pseudomallei]
MQQDQQHDSVDVFVGVDVGKGQHHAVALDRNGKRLYNKALPNDEAKLRALISELKAHGRLLFVVDQPAKHLHRYECFDHRPDVHSRMGAHMCVRY